MQIHYPEKRAANSEAVSMESLLRKLTKRWIEKSVYTRTSSDFSISMEELPPFIAPCVANDEVVNTENQKKSVYLQKDVLG